MKYKLCTFLALDRCLQRKERKRGTKKFKREETCYEIEARNVSRLLPLNKITVINIELQYILMVSVLCVLYIENYNIRLVVVL